MKKKTAKKPKPIGEGPSKPLKNAKHERFCQEYIVANNKSQAAIRAGYSENRADSRGAQLWGIVSIKERIKYLQTQLSKKSGIAAERVINELGKVAFANIKNILETGNKIKDLSKLPDDITAAVESVQTITQTTTNKKGTKKYTITNVKVKFHSKLSALTDLGKHLGIFEKDNAQKIPPETKPPLTEEELAKRLKELNEAGTGLDEKSISGGGG